MYYVGEIIPNTHRLFIILKGLPSFFQVTHFLYTLSLQVALQQLLKQTSVMAFVPLQDAASCLTGKKHLAYGWRGD